MVRVLLSFSSLCEVLCGRAVVVVFAIGSGGDLWWCGCCDRCHRYLWCYVAVWLVLSSSSLCVVVCGGVLGVVVVIGIVVMLRLCDCCHRCRQCTYATGVARM